MEPRAWRVSVRSGRAAFDGGMKKKEASASFFVSMPSPRSPSVQFCRRLPENLRHALAPGDGAGGDEQQVGEPVQVAQADALQRFLLVQRLAAPFGAARQATARTWAWATRREPPGRMKFFSGPSSSFQRSMQLSRRATSVSSRARYSGIASSPPRSNRRCCTGASAWTISSRPGCAPRASSSSAGAGPTGCSIRPPRRSPRCVDGSWAPGVRRPGRSRRGRRYGCRSSTIDCPWFQPSSSSPRRRLLPGCGRAGGRALACAGATASELSSGRRMLKQVPRPSSERTSIWPL